LMPTNDLGTKRGGCGNEELMALGIANLPMGQNKKCVRAGRYHG
jgi:hypothetical protein